MAAAWPLCPSSGFGSEQVDGWVQLLHAAHSRTAEARLITTMVSGSTVAVENTVLGAARDVLATLDSASARSWCRSRLPDDTQLRLIAPVWLRRMMRTDLVKSPETRSRTS